MAKKVISTRLDSEHLAKAIDGLKLKGYKTDQLSTLSGIVRLTFYYGLASLGMASSDVKASPESQQWVARNLTQNGKNRTIGLGGLR